MPSARAVYHLPRLGPEINQTLAEPEALGPHCQAHGNQGLERRKEGMQWMEPERRISTSALLFSERKVW